MTARIEKFTTAGIFALDGQEWDVENNVWIVGDDAECILIDAPHDAAAILAAIGDRTLRAIVLTHAHSDHIDAVPGVRDATGAPVMLASADRVLWDQQHPNREPDSDLRDGDEIEVAGTTLRAIATPGHSPGSTCLYAEDLGTLFSGDTLFAGGPGATGRSFSDFPTIIESIRERLLTLPAETRVLPGHGDETTIGSEAPHLEEWIARGH